MKARMRPGAYSDRRTDTAGGRTADVRRIRDCALGQGRASGWPQRKYVGASAPGMIALSDTDCTINMAEFDLRWAPAVYDLVLTSFFGGE